MRWGWMALVLTGCVGTIVVDEENPWRPATEEATPPALAESRCVNDAGVWICGGADPLCACHE